MSLKIWALFDIVGTVYHLVIIYVQSDKIH